MNTSKDKEKQSEIYFSKEGTYSLEDIQAVTEIVKERIGEFRFMYNDLIDFSEATIKILISIVSASFFIYVFSGASYLPDFIRDSFFSGEWDDLSIPLFIFGGATYFILRMMSGKKGRLFAHWDWEENEKGLWEEVETVLKRKSNSVLSKEIDRILNNK